MPPQSKISKSRQNTKPRLKLVYYECKRLKAPNLQGFSDLGFVGISFARHIQSLTKLSWYIFKYN